MITSPILAEHLRRNSTTRGRWEAVASHRARVMEVLRDARKAVGARRGSLSGTSLCVLGPGNGNDIELARLVRDFERVSLVDLDREAVARAVARLGEDESQRVKRFCPVDLSGVLPILESWRRNGKPTAAEYLAVLERVKIVPRPDVGAFDVVASTCMLTQLIDSVYMSLPTTDPRRAQLLMAVQQRHLEIILELVKPGGTGVLVTDFVEAKTAPALAQLDQLLVPHAAPKWLEQRNFFVGADPFAIRDFYKGLQPPGPNVEDVQVKGAWRWEVGGKQLGVCAVVFRRR